MIKVLMPLGLMLLSQSASADALLELIRPKSKQEWSAQKSSGLNTNRCKEQLTLGMIPTACYGVSPLSRGAVAMVDRACVQAAAHASDLKSVSRALTTKTLSPECRTHLENRGRVLAYKLEEVRPSEAFEYLRRESGPGFEQLPLHASSSPSQSDSVSAHRNSRRRSK